jgi:hypothetical protein
VIYHDGSIKYSGGMKNGKKHGLGIYKTTEFEMTGNWEHDKLHGKECRIVYLD